MSISIPGNLLVNRVGTRSKASEAMIVLGTVGLLVLSAQIQIPMFPVPMTLQTLVVLLAASALGPVRSLVAISSYIVLGIIGLPVFAGTKALSGALPTAGYLVGFLVAALAVGQLAKIGLSKSPLQVFASYSLGSFIIYFSGVFGLMATLGLSLGEAIAAGVIPFLIGDAVKACLAAALLPAAWKLVGTK